MSGVVTKHRAISLLVLVLLARAVPATAQLTSSLHASGFTTPIAFVQDPTDSTVQLVVEQGGRVRVVRNGVVLPTDFLDLSGVITVGGGETGLLGLAFAPDYASSGRVYVNFTNRQGHTVIARFRRSVNPLVADPASRFDLGWGGVSGPRFIAQPFANHNGGNLAFGSDGFLYIGLGDGGSANDPDHRSQNPQELLGKMLRIDVNVPDSDPIGYQVPPDNPFLDGSPISARAEIWSFGWRNPWRYSFDDPAHGGTGALIVGDVGQGTLEEIDYEPAGRGGRNYGWRNREGTVDFVMSLPPAFTPLTDPIHAYGRSLGQSVTGGVVYRGRLLGTAYVGRYFFADFSSGRIWSMGLTIDPVTHEATAQPPVEHTASLAPVGNVSSFGVDADGELYFVSYVGTVKKILATPVAPIVTAHPGNQSKPAGVAASFVVAATGAPVPAVQWQTSTDGVSWVDVSNGPPYSGATTATLTVTTAVTLNGRRYRAVVSNSAGSAASASALLTVEGVVGASPTALQFAATKSGASLVAVTGAQGVRVSFAGAAAGWTASANQPWLQLSNAAGPGAAEFTVAIVNPGDVIGTATTLNGIITIVVPSTGEVATVLVTLNIKPMSSTTAPFGAFDTPSAGVTVSGSIAVTGWALDDIGVTRVEIWRDRASGETTPPYPGPGPGQGKVFIADAFVVGGARPDIETAYATLPRSAQAGWGYLLLTQGLWNRGNGPFTLYAFAYDAEGHSTVLGSKTITVNNATAVKPFGAIDTPGYGQTVSGGIWNFGWALTPNATPACTIGPDGVQVSIDSGPLQPVSYGDLRTDIAASFPGFTNAGGAGGAYFIDTTTLSNGTHQIGWLVIDSCGRAEGIGSRFFTVINSGSSTTRVDTVAVVGPASAPAIDPIDVHRGVMSESVAVNPAGTRVVIVAQGERVALALPPSDGGYMGYHVINGERRGLPLGSSLDAGQGIFYWQPAAGFLGAHDLEFESGRGVVRVRVVIGTSVQSVIDTPAPGPVASPFVVAGWAIEEAATTGTGIDTVHVWAYPVTGASPIFLGVAAYGDARADIAALFGDQFAGAAYGLTAALPPGVYDVVVYPHSFVTGDFHGAQLVRITVQ